MDVIHSALYRVLVLAHFVQHIAYVLQGISNGCWHYFDRGDDSR